MSHLVFAALLVQRVIHIHEYSSEDSKLSSGCSHTWLLSNAYATLILLIIVMNRMITNYEGPDTTTQQADPQNRLASQTGLEL